MAEIAKLSVGITADTTGLLSALADAEKALARFESLNGSVGNAGGNYHFEKIQNDWFKSEKGLLEHYKKTHSMSYEEEIKWWESLLDLFAYDSSAVREIEEGIYTAKENMEKALKEADTEALSSYKKSSDDWIRHQTEVNSLGVDGQIDAYNRQLQSYNAMVSEIVASTLYSSEEIKAIWNDFYDYKADVDLKIGKLENEKNYAVYEKWKSHADGWKAIRDTYDDWYEAGDSPVKFYERSIAKIQEMYDGGYIGWQEYRDDTMEAKLNLYEAKMEQVNELLERQKAYIADVKAEFDAEEKALFDSWAVADRRASKAEISRQLGIYKNAVTQRGIDKYESLREEMKQIRREEEMYALQKAHTERVAELEESYKIVEANKKYLLAHIEKSGTNIESIVGSVNYDIKNMESTITSLFVQTINAIKAISTSSNSYSDNRNISINSNASSVIEALVNRVGMSVAYGNFY